jgi:CHC2 zinc finger
MARIPDGELERLKQQVSLVRIIEAQGHKLVSQGKNLACRCPWHEGDDTPSCIVTPATNLWHCPRPSQQAPKRPAQIPASLGSAAPLCAATPVVFALYVSYRPAWFGRQF